MNVDLQESAYRLAWWMRSLSWLIVVITDLGLLLLLGAIVGAFHISGADFNLGWAVFGFVALRAGATALELLARIDRNAGRIVGWARDEPENDE